MTQQPPTVVHKVGPKTYEKDSNPQLIHCQHCKKEVMTIIELITTDPNKWIGVLQCICLWPICLVLGKDYYIDGRNTQLISLEKNVHWGREKGPPKLHPRGGFFGP